MLLIILTATSGQVAVAPLFPLGAAVPDFLLAALVAITYFGGVRAAMVAIPVGALSLGLQSDREPGVVLLGYLALVPFAAWLAEARVPITGLGRFLATGMVTGVLSRTTLALAAVSRGAEPSPGALSLHILIPGLVLDLALLAVVYTACRSVRWEPIELTLQKRGRYR